MVVRKNQGGDGQPQLTASLEVETDWMYSNTVVKDFLTSLGTKVAETIHDRFGFEAQLAQAKQETELCFKAILRKISTGGGVSDDDDSDADTVAVSVDEDLSLDYFMKSDNRMSEAVEVCPELVRDLRFGTDPPIMNYSSIYLHISILLIDSECHSLQAELALRLEEFLGELGQNKLAAAASEDDDDDSDR